MQANWVKANTAAGYLILHTGAEGLKMIEHMEAGGDRVSGNSFRVMEGIYVPEDYTKIVEKVRAGDNVNTSRMREVATEVLTERWWSWVLLHPDLPEDKVHPSRRVFFCLTTVPFLQVFVCYGFLQGFFSQEHTHTLGFFM